MFLAIAVDNLADAESLTAIEKEAADAAAEAEAELEKSNAETASEAKDGEDGLEEDDENEENAEETLDDEGKEPEPGEADARRRAAKTQVSPVPRTRNLLTASFPSDEQERRRENRYRAGLRGRAAGGRQQRR